MPVKRLRYTFNYCKTNPIGFFIILVLLGAIGFINRTSNSQTLNVMVIYLISALIITTLIQGYGLVITKDTIRDGKKLPKILIKECLIFGIKALTVIMVYSFFEYIFLNLLSASFGFPIFELKFAIAHMKETLSQYYATNPLYTFEFIICSIIVTYVLAFFMEISLARLADGGRLLGAINLPSIKKCIDTIGWRHYTVDYTKIILSIFILAYLQYGFDYLHFFTWIIDLIFGLLIFIIEFIGIGKIYKEYKVKSETMGIDIE